MDAGGTDHGWGVVDDRPAESGELASDCHGDDGPALAALELESAPDAVQVLLGVPGDRDYGLVLAVLAALERRAEPGRAAVVPGGFDEQPPGVSAAGLRDRALAAGLAGAVLARHEPEVSHQPVGVLEAGEVADLDRQPDRR